MPRHNSIARSQLSDGQKRDFISASPMFYGISNAELNCLVGSARLLVTKQGETVFTVGEPIHEFHLVGSGALQVNIGSWVSNDIDDAMASESDVESTLLLEVLGPGDIVCDVDVLSLLADEAICAVRQTSAQVLTRSACLLAVRRQTLAQLLQRHPSIRTRLARRFLERVRRTQQLAVETAVLRTRGRVRLARLLQDLFNRFGVAGKQGVELPANLSQNALGQALGLSRRSIFKDMSVLKHCGAVAHARDGRLTLVNAALLNQMATAIRS